jgi:hypothetical protein
MFFDTRHPAAYRNRGNRLKTSATLSAKPEQLQYTGGTTGSGLALTHFALFPSMTRRLSLFNQIFKSLQAETADIDLALAVDDLLRKRLPDRRRVFKSMA